MTSSCWQKLKKMETDTNNKNILPGYRNGIWHRKMGYANNEKWEKTNTHIYQPLRLSRM